MTVRLVPGVPRSLLQKEFSVITDTKVCCSLGVLSQTNCGFSVAVEFERSKQRHCGVLMSRRNTDQKKILF